ETSYNPVTITGVTQSPAATVWTNQSANITVTLSGAKNANEKVFVRYTTNNWTNSSFVEITSFNGSHQGTATIPGQTSGTSVSYYALTTIDATPDASDIDYLTLNLNNNSNNNYSYTVSALWCNLQWPENGAINPGSTFDVYAQIYAQGVTEAAGQGAGITAWIGYNTSDTDPATWTNWIPASYYGDAGNNDEYFANIGSSLSAGQYYYASRFQEGSGPYYYGGYHSGTGGFWDGSANVSGVLTVREITWCNLQSPSGGTIITGGTFDVYARVYAAGVTDAAGQGSGIQAWIGYSTNDTDPSTWTNWVVASYYSDAGNNDEYKVNIGTSLPAGTYYYASRFQLGNGTYRYGGYNSGYWDGGTSVSGVLTVNDISINWCNLQGPETGGCNPGGTYMVYSRIYAQGLTDVISGQAPGIQAWIGYSTSNTNPSTWTNWIASQYFGEVNSGNNDEYQTNIGTALPAGHYYYASRFQLGTGTYVYGGYNAGGGGFWDGSANVSGELTVGVIPSVSLQNVVAGTGTVSVNLYMNDFSNLISGFGWTIEYDYGDLFFLNASDWAAGVNPVDVDITEDIPGSLAFVGSFFPSVTVEGKLCQLNFTYSSAALENLMFTGSQASLMVGDDNSNEYLLVSWIDGTIGPCNGVTNLWTGASGANWDVAGNWSCGTVPVNSTDVVIPDVANQPVVSSVNTSVCRSVTIEEDASLTVNSGSDLAVYGNWINAGQTTVGAGKITLMGSSPQTVTGTTSFRDLTINNANGVNLNDPTQVSGVLTLSQGTLAGNGNLTLTSDASGTALIASSGSGTVTGNVTMQRYIPIRLGYHYFSSPFNGASIHEMDTELGGTLITGNPYIGNDTTQTVTPFPNFFMYNETMGPTMSIGWTGAGSTLETMRGYCVNLGASSAPLTADISGTVNNGPYSYNLTKTATGNTYADGWNLVGNPYPSPIDWNALSGWNKSNIVNSVYFFNPTTQYTGTYSSYAGGIGVPGDINGIIPAMQGFFVKATGSGPFSVTNDVRISELNPVFHKSTANTTLLRLKGYPTANEPSGDETVIYFDPQASYLFDSDLDAFKMMNSDQIHPNIFTRDSSVYSLSINSLPPLSNMDVVIPLGFMTKTNGSFTITATEILNFDSQVHIYLQDNQNITSQDLTANPEYTFNINANDPLYRFFIRFSPSVITGISDNSANVADAWASGRDIYVNYSNSVNQNADIIIYDILGQEIIKTKMTANIITHFRMEKPGCFIVNVVNGSVNFQKKVIIL
ncbi:MAG TPA: T9SS type A sorting domain-containing protein, partial [Bacteroidales bacterium]|nr:T9SS type A sorting domain-containing protein [Bacteroidales bacterium]